MANSKRVSDCLVTVSGYLSIRDYKEYNLLHSRLNNFFVRFVFYFLIFFGTTLVVTKINNNELSINSIVIFILSGLGVSILAVSLVVSIRNIKLKRIFQSDKFINKEYIYNFGDNGMEINSESSNSFIEWSEIYKIKENNKLIVIYIGKNRGMVLPKTFFKNEEELNQLKEIMRNKLSIDQYK
jgi:hypothetical protein